MRNDTPTTTDSRPTRRVPAIIVVGVLCFGSLSAALMQSLVIPIQRELPHLLDTTASNASWVVTATLLASAVTMPIAGRLADIVGKKPVLIASSLLLVLGSLVCALSGTLAPVLVGRVLQGASMGYIPVAISMVREVAPARKVNTAVAAVSGTMGVGGALGLPLAAWIAEEASWNMLFWVSGGLAAVVAVLSVVLLPNPDDAHPARLDLLGALGLGVALVSVLVGVSKGSEWGWGDPKTLGLLAFGVVVALLWGWYELRHEAPLVDLRTTAKRPVLMTNLAALLIGFGMMAQSIVVPQLLEMPGSTGHGLGQTILQAGLWMAPAGLMMLLFAPVSSRLLSGIGARATLAIGALVLSGGYVLAVFLMGAPWQLTLATCVSSAGVAIGYAALPTLIMDNVPEDEAGSSVGVNALMRSMGTTVAGAVMAAVLAGHSVTVDGAAVPSLTAFQICFLAGAIAAASGAALALLVPRARKSRSASVVLEPQPAG